MRQKWWVQGTPPWLYALKREGMQPWSNRIGRVMSYFVVGQRQLCPSRKLTCMQCVARRRGECRSVQKRPETVLPPPNEALWVSI